MSTEIEKEVQKWIEYKKSKRISSSRRSKSIGRFQTLLASVFGLIISAICGFYHFESATQFLFTMSFGLLLLVPFFDFQIGEKETYPAAPSYVARISPQDFHDEALTQKKVQELTDSAEFQKHVTAPRVEMNVENQKFECLEDEIEAIDKILDYEKLK